MRHEKEAPGLLEALRPYTRRLRGLRYPAAPLGERFRRTLFLTAPRLFLAMKRYTPAHS